MKRTPKKTIKDLLCRDTEKPVLEELYLEHAVPSDQLRREPGVLARIVAAFNRITGRDFDPETLLRYIFNRRKDKDWPSLGTSARRFQPGASLLQPEHDPVLRRIYQELDQASDDVLFDRGLTATLARRFHAATGVRVPGSQLVAFIFAKRKRGEWVKIGERPFSDIAEVALQAKRA